MTCKLQVKIMNVTKQRKTAQKRNIRKNIINYRIKRLWGMVGGWGRVIFGEKKPLCYGVPINIHGVDDPVYIFPPTFAKKVFKEGEKIIHVPD